MGFINSIKKNKEDTILVLFMLVFTMILVYSPHLDYPYPLHIDEWRHLTEGRKLVEGEYEFNHITFEIGIHALIGVLYKISNPVLIYRFLPALTSAIASLMLFGLLYRLTNRFWIGLFGMLFYASIKSNVNSSGPWFFIPLTMCIPLIYLFGYLLVSGVKDENVKKIIGAFLVYLSIIFIHPLSASFMIPILMIYAMVNFRLIMKFWRWLTPIAIIPVIGYCFVGFMTDQWNIKSVYLRFIFRHGWGVHEIPLSISHGYTVVGAIFAIIGLWYAYHRRFHLFIIWPAVCIAMLIFYSIFGLSIFAPYQRYYFYLILSLPILSAFGLYFVYVNARAGLRKLVKNKRRIDSIISWTIILIMFITMNLYFHTPTGVEAYKLIDDDDYNALKFLEDEREGRVMAPLNVGTALYPISGKIPIATVFFYGNRDNVEEFYGDDCEGQDKMIDRWNIRYVYSVKKLDCGHKMIYDKGPYIYLVKVK